MVPKNVSEETVGLRSFQVRKAHAVERALDKIRQGVGREWQGLPDPDIEILELVLGELWAMVGFREWDYFPFSFCRLAHVQEMVAGGKQMINREKPGTTVLAEIKRMMTELEKEAELKR